MARLPFLAAKPKRRRGPRRKWTHAADYAPRRMSARQRRLLAFGPALLVGALAIASALYVADQPPRALALTR